MSEDTDAGTPPESYAGYERIDPSSSPSYGKLDGNGQELASRPPYEPKTPPEYSCVLAFYPDDMVGHRYLAVPIGSNPQDAKWVQGWDIHLELRAAFLMTVSSIALRGRAKPLFSSAGEGLCEHGDNVWPSYPDLPFRDIGYTEALAEWMATEGLTLGPEWDGGSNERRPPGSIVLPWASHLFVPDTRVPSGNDDHDDDSTDDEPDAASFKHAASPDALDISDGAGAGAGAGTSVFGGGGLMTHSPSRVRRPPLPGDTVTSKSPCHVGRTTTRAHPGETVFPGVDADTTATFPLPPVDAGGSTQHIRRLVMESSAGDQRAADMTMAPLLPLPPTLVATIRGLATATGSTSWGQLLASKREYLRILTDALNRLETTEMASMSPLAGGASVHPCLSLTPVHRSPSNRLPAINTSHQAGTTRVVIGKDGTVSSMSVVLNGSPSRGRRVATVKGSTPSIPVDWAVTMAYCLSLPLTASVTARLLERAAEQASDTMARTLWPQAMQQWLGETSGDQLPRPPSLLAFIDKASATLGTRPPTGLRSRSAFQKWAEPLLEHGNDGTFPFTQEAVTSAAARYLQAVESTFGMDSPMSTLVHVAAARVASTGTLLGSDFDTFNGLASFDATMTALVAHLHQWSQMAAAAQRGSVDPPSHALPTDTTILEPLVVPESLRKTSLFKTATLAASLILEARRDARLRDAVAARAARKRQTHAPETSRDPVRDHGGSGGASGGASAVPPTRVGGGYQDVTLGPDGKVTRGVFSGWTAAQAATAAGMVPSDSGVCLLFLRQRCRKNDCRRAHGDWTKLVGTQSPPKWWGKAPLSVVPSAPADPAPTSKAAGTGV